MQKIIVTNDLKKEIFDITLKENISKYMLVCGKSIALLGIDDLLNDANFNHQIFSGVSPNPTTLIVEDAVRTYKNNKCDAILAIGGGSPIDVAKGVKDLLVLEKNVPKFIAVPTTAGSGAESTSVAVIYKDGVKMSVGGDILLPDYAILVPKFLMGLPKYQKKCTVFDALAQAIESLWSVSSTDKSKEYARKAIKLIVPHVMEYINENKHLEEISLGANYAGRAINISRTTAPHAMSYKLTTLYNLPHGHSVALSLPIVWEFMINNIEKCIDTRGVDCLKNIFQEIATLLGYQNIDEAIKYIHNLIKVFDLKAPNILPEELDALVNSVDVERLGNTPVAITKADLNELYKMISK